MPQLCTKFRLFNLLLVLCVINGVLFRSYFINKLDTRRFSNLTVRDVARTSPRTLLTTITAVSSTPSSPDVTTTTAPLGPVGGPGPTLEAKGKVVKPLAGVKAPWSSYNVTELCPLVPPKLGECLFVWTEVCLFITS